MPTVKEFLLQHGHSALVSLGSGSLINCIDNHLKLVMALNLDYYVAVDLEPTISCNIQYLFDDDASMLPLLEACCHRNVGRFLERIRVFPSTAVEELFGLHCSVVVCQRVLPFFHWESLIQSMTPKLVLQEGLHGCELQDLGGGNYRRYRAGIRRFGLKPFRPWRIIPWEYNLILWRHESFPAKL